MDKKSLKFPEALNNQLDLSETQIASILVHQNLRFFQLHLTDNRLLVIQYNTLGRPSLMQSIFYDDMTAGRITTGKKKTITLKWKGDSVFSAEFDSKNVDEARQIASIFPSYEEIVEKRTLLEKVEIFGWVLCGITIFILAVFGIWIQDTRDQLFPIAMLCLSFSLSLIGIAVLMRNENIRGHTGWNARLFGFFMLMMGLFLGWRFLSFFLSL